MALPNLSTLRCCPAPTSTILTRPLSTDVCPVCHEPPFGCEGTAPGSAADDWRRCAPEQWRIRPNDGDGAPMTVAVMRRCNALVHVSCLQGWIDAKRAADPRRATCPCPACAGTECVSPELLEDVSRPAAPLQTRAERWSAVKLQIMHGLDASARICDGNYHNLTRTLGSTIPIMHEVLEWLNTRPVDVLHGMFRKRFDDAARQVYLLTVLPYENAAVQMREMYTTQSRDMLVVQYQEARGAFVAHVPLIGEMDHAMPDLSSTVLERAETFVKLWEPLLHRRGRRGSRVIAQIREVRDHAQRRLRELQDLHGRLLAEQQEGEDAADFYQLMHNSI